MRSLLEKGGRSLHDTVPRNRLLGRAWVFLCLALGLHTFDEASTGFLAVYNPTVVALRQQLGWWPMPTFQLGEWLAGLIMASVVLLALSGLVARGARGTRVLAYIFAIIMLLNAGSHTLFSLLGRTVASVTFSRPAPGFWSSPFMAAAAIYLLHQLRKPSPQRAA